MTNKIVIRGISWCLAGFMMLGCICWNEPVYAAEKNKESIITDVKNPENGVIKYKVTVPPGEKIDYSVTLPPDKPYKLPEVSKGSYKNKTKKTVTKTVTVKVKCFSDKYKICASYTSDYKGEEIMYSDQDKAVSALKTTVTTAKLKWNFAELGKGQKEWKYRYKFQPYKQGIKKQVEVFNAKGKKIKSYVKEIIPITKITEVIDIIRAR